MIIKFDPLNKPSFVTQDFILNDIGTGQQVIGYYVTIDNNDIRVVAGDYFIVNKNQIKVILKSDYDNDTDVKREVVKEVAIELMENIIQGFVDLSATNLQKMAILRHIDPVQGMIIANKLNAALVIASDITALPTTTEFTTARRNAYIALIQTAVNKL